MAAFLSKEFEMKNKPKDATHFNEQNGAYYKASSENPNDMALYSDVVLPEIWVTSEFWENEDLNIDTDVFKKV